MFKAAKIHMARARRFVTTAKALKGFSRKSMIEYLELAEQQLVMVELYIK